MKKILITGGTTFVSKFIAEYFVNAGCQVYVINRGSRKQIDNVNLIKCDRFNLDNQLKNIHFNAVIDVTAYNKQHIETLVNSLGNFDDYVFISSSAVYPETNPQPFTEEQRTGENSIWGDYGINKMEAEKFLLNTVPNAYILRPSYLYGMYNNLYREAFVFDCAMADRPFYIPQNGEMKLQFFSVNDLCRFIDIILNKHPENHIFNVGNKESISVKDWVELCYKIVGKKAKLISVDKDVFQRDYFCFYNYEYYLDVTKQYKLMPNTENFVESLKQEFEWYKHNTDSIYRKNPYIDFIENNLANKR